jgi:hypothetical protein
MTPIAQVNHLVTQPLAQRRTSFIKCDDLASNIKANYTADRKVLDSLSVPVGSITEKSLRTLPVSLNPVPLGRKAHPKLDFISSEVGARNDDIPTPHRHSHQDVKLQILASLRHHHETQRRQLVHVLLDLLL